MDFSGILGAEIAQKKARKRQGTKERDLGTKKPRRGVQDLPTAGDPSSDVSSMSEPINAGSTEVDDVGAELSKIGKRDENDSLQGYKDASIQNEVTLDIGQTDQKSSEFQEQQLAGQTLVHVTAARSIGEIDKDLHRLATKKLTESEKTQFQKLRQERVNLQLKSQQSLEETVPFLIEVQDIIIKPQPRERLHLQIRKYLKHLVKKWEEASKNSTDRLLLQETKQDLIVILHLLRRYQLLESMLISLCTVIHHVQQAQFGRANESYMQLSIGNTVWPIGVRNVGIHQRAADQKITGDDKSTRSNIMIDDATRRWITAIKRLITFAERNPLVIT